MGETKELRKKILGSSGMKHFRALLGEYGALSLTWNAHIKSLMRSRNMTAEGLANDCGKSINTVRVWIKKPPLQREKVIHLGMALKLSESEINNLLVRYARFPRLYSKNPDDVIFTFMLKPGNRTADSLAYQFAKYSEIFLQEVWHAACIRVVDAVYGGLQNWAEHMGMDTFAAEGAIRGWERTAMGFRKACAILKLDANQANELIDFAYLSVKHKKSIMDDDKFLSGLNQNSYSASRASVRISIGDKMKKGNTEMLHIRLETAASDSEMKFNNFRGYVRENLGDLFARYERPHEFLKAFCASEMPSIELEVAGASKQVKNRLIKSISKMRSKWKRKREDAGDDLFTVPNRDELIALGIYLRMTYSQIDKLLKLSGMEELCPKHPIEAAVLFVLGDLERHAPSEFFDSAADLPDTEEIDKDSEMFSYFKRRLSVIKNGGRYNQLVGEIGHITGLPQRDIEAQISSKGLEWVEARFSEQKRHFDKRRYTELYFNTTISDYVKRRIMGSCLGEEFISSVLYTLL